MKDVRHIPLPGFPRRRTQSLAGRWPISNQFGATTMVVTALKLTPASDRDADTGLLAFIALELDGLVHIDGVGLRLTEDGRLSLSFPSRTSRRGTKHALLRPVNSDALGIRQEAAR
jgi:hypothetical protein